MKLRALFRLLLVFSVLLSLSCSGGDDSSSDNGGGNNPPPNEPTVLERLQSVVDAKVGNDADKLVGVSVSIRVGNEERWSLVGGISK